MKELHHIVKKSMMMKRYHNTHLLLLLYKERALAIDRRSKYDMMFFNKYLIFYLIAILTLVLFPSLTFAGRESLKKQYDESLISRSLLSKGDVLRIKNVFMKAKRGDDIVIGVIGGSITKGYSATQQENKWANIVYRWWNHRFPNSTVRLVNAAVSGTGSNYGAHRVKDELLKYEPDFVIAEFAVNDTNDILSAETMEGLTRQILKGTKSPALLFVFFTYENGSSAQEWHSRVGTHYGIPMISYRDAILPEIKSGRLKWEDVSPDSVHPNNRGHQYCAAFIISFFESVLNEMNGNDRQHEIPVLAAPLISDMYEYTEIYSNTNIVPVKNTGWSKYEEGWQAYKAGSEIEFLVKGQVVSLMFDQSRETHGVAEVMINDSASVRLNGWMDRLWLRKEIAVIAKNIGRGNHILKIKMLNDRKSDEKYIFRIRAIMAAGL